MNQLRREWQKLMSEETQSNTITMTSETTNRSHIQWKEQERKMLKRQSLSDDHCNAIRQEQREKSACTRLSITKKQHIRNRKSQIIRREHLKKKNSLQSERKIERKRHTTGSWGKKYPLHPRKCTLWRMQKCKALQMQHKKFDKRKIQRLKQKKTPLAKNNATK